MMKNFLSFTVLVFICIACIKTKSVTADTLASTSSEKDQFLVIDVTKKYPKSERICIQDIADVEYIPLESNADFLCNGTVDYIDNDCIIYGNRDGAILIFDRQGKAKHKIKRKGQGGQEYVTLNSLLYDKEKNELYVNDMWQQKILVYDIEGHYKRRFPHLPGSQYKEIYLFDNQCLLCYNISGDNFDKEKHPYKIVAKETGKLVKELDIPFSKRVTATYSFTKDGALYLVPVNPYPEWAVRTGNAWILNEVSSDSIYQLMDDYTLKPVMAQTPSVQSMGENPQYIGFVMDNYHYQFMFIQKKEFDIKTQTGFPTTSIMYDKKTGKIFGQNFYNANCPDQDFYFDRNHTNQMAESNQYFYTFDASELKDLLTKGKLTGRLKEIAGKIDEDDNPVLMIITFRK